jgi:hypothetical protein
MRKLTPDEILFGMVEGERYIVRDDKKVYMDGPFERYVHKNNQVYIFIKGQGWNVYYTDEPRFNANLINTSSPIWVETDD